MDTERTNTVTLSLLEDAAAYNRWIFAKIRPYLKGTILEVGCGIGNLTGYLLEEGKVIASDVNPSYLQTVENKHRNHPNWQGTFLWDIDQPPPQSVKVLFETILCSNVLEHLREDERVLNHFYRILPEGGQLILLVPALKMLYNRLDRELGHFRRYSRAEAARKIIEAGFKIRLLSYFNPFGMMGWFVNGTLLRRRLLPSKQVRLFNKMVPLFARIEKMIPNLTGQSLILVGEKREEKEKI